MNEDLGAPPQGLHLSLCEVSPICGASFVLAVVFSTLEICSVNFIFLHKNYTLTVYPLFTVAGMSMNRAETRELN